MVGSCMNGPTWARLGMGGSRERSGEQRGRETLLAQSSGRSHHGQPVRSKIIMTWQIINKHSRVISKAKLMNSFQVFYSRPKNTFYCILICIELATDRQTNNNTNWIRFINILLKLWYFRLWCCWVGSGQRFNHYFNLLFWWVTHTSLFCVRVF